MREADRASMNDELYNDTIMDHGECRDFQGALEPPALKVDAFNPLCGDDISLYAIIDDNDVIQQIQWDTETDACIISRASASMLAESLSGKTIGDAKQMASEFQSLIRGQFDGEPASLGDLMAFESLSRNPRRVKCAAMAWAALDDILLSYESNRS